MRCAARSPGRPPRNGTQQCLSQDDQHALYLAGPEAEIDRLREDRDIKARDWQDGLAINTEFQTELAAARTRLAELEAK